MASLVYHSGALGDFVTALPAFEVWKREHPDEPLVLMGKPAHGALVPHLFDDAWDAGSSRYARLFSADCPGGEARLLLPGVTSALVFAREASPLSAVLSRSRLDELVRQDPFPAADVHVVDYHLQLFGNRVNDGDRTPRIRVAPAATGDSPGAGGPAPAFVAIHHGSGSARKNWPRDRFEALASRLHGRGYRAAWISGPADDDAPPRCEAQRWDRLPLPDLAARLAACRLFVGNDSGVAHLAAAVGCPTVALFGVSSDRVWAPRGRRVRVLRASTGRVQDITLEEALSVVLDFLGESR